jgi:hypothetical protein
MLKLLVAVRIMPYRRDFQKPKNGIFEWIKPHCAVVSAVE